MSIDFERLFEALPTPYMLLDRDLCFVAVNAAYEGAVMRCREELIGRNIFDEFPNDGEAGRRLRESFELVFETGKTDTLAYIHYEIPRPADQGGGMEHRYWTAVHTPLNDTDGKLAYLIQNTVDVTNIVRLNEAASLPFSPQQGEAQLLERAREAEEQHRSLLAESADFRRLFQQAPGFFAVLSSSNHVFTFANDAYVRLVGGRNVVGMSVAEALPELDGQGFLEMLDTVYETGKPTGGEAARLMLQRGPEEEPRETFLDFSYDAIRNRGGEIIGIFVQGMDRTEAVKTQRRQKLLLDELNHRVKNTLATVQSIASQTLRSTPDIAQARRDIESRIVALSKAHNLLSAQQWSEAALREIAANEFDPIGGRATARGPKVVLAPKAAIAMAMIVHELTTNSLKYGALSVPEGRAELAWSVREDGQVVEMRWTDSNGPAVAEPTRRGFGSRMIETIVIGELGGEYRPYFGIEGFACEIAMDASVLAEGMTRSAIDA